MTTTRRRIVIAAAAVVILGGLLLADLYSRGLAWRAFYNLTGEESPPSQIIGMTHWAGRWFRQQPQTAPYTPMDHIDVPPYGINVFLEQEAEIEKRERILQMVSDAGFVWLRQEFPWEDIEIHGRGDFEDRRNDMDGDGEIDTISAWDKYDNIVGLTEQYGLRLQARLSNPPRWTHSDPAVGDFAPPDDIQDYVNFATTVAERYKGRIFHYQIWNEPNIFPEWGDRFVDPAGYTDMLCRTYDALKAVDPEIVVVSAALAQTNAMDGRNLNDYFFLQRMLDAGAADCFDILAVQGYGLNSGPTDRRMRATTVNFSRPMYIRDILVRNGHADKPIWISEAAWNPVPEPDEVPEVDARYNFGQVTEEQAARYMVDAYQRQQEEWPFTGVMFYWFFKRATDFETNQSFYYFRMVEPDFTPLPVYGAMRDYTANLTPTLYKGVHQEDHWALMLPDTATIIEVEGAQLDDAVQTDGVSFMADGTELAVRWQGGEAITLHRDEEAIGTFDSDDEATYTDGDWHEVRVRLSWLAAPHAVRIDAADDTLLLDSVTVYDDSVRDVVIIAALGLVVVTLLVGGVRAAR
ncbi:MAG: hypothetical protein AAF653_02460, partial [Chloroflexota bacterium]